MKISFEWIQDYCKFQGTPKELATLLRNLGVGLEAIEEVAGDACLDLEITTNRPDLNGMIGLAREISAATGSPLAVPDIRLKKSSQRVEASVRVQVDSPDLCPRYTARVITGVRVGPSPDWMQRRLTVIGLRPINNIVDITNYVLMEACQPLHAYDHAKLSGGWIVVRQARGGESITAIDGTSCKLSPDMLVIADAERPVAIAGVMGGKDTEVSADTTTVVLESAQFQPVSIRRTSRALGLFSDSSYRFERGVDPEGVEWASRRAAALLEELAGGIAAEGLQDLWPGRKKPLRVTLRMPEVARTLGAPVPAARVQEDLARLHLKVLETQEQEIAFQVPSFRPDLEREIDLIEEVARLEGYGTIPTRTGLTLSSSPRPLRERMEALVHEVMTASGFDEVRTTTFLHTSVAEEVSPWSSGPALTIRNPVRKEENALRRSLIPHLLQVKKTNEDHGHPAVHLYEMAPAYLRDQPASPAYEKQLLTFIHGGEFGETKGVLETLGERLRLQAAAVFEPAAPRFLEAGSAAAAWKSGDRVWAYLGTASQSLVQRYDLHTAPAIAEVDLDALLAITSFDKRLQPLPKFPPTDRDIAIIIAEEVKWDQIVQTVRAVSLPVLRSIVFFDLYHGENIEPGKKSIAFRLVFQSEDRTLTHEEVNEHRDAIVARLGDQLGAKLR